MLRRFLTLNTQGAVVCDDDPAGIRNFYYGELYQHCTNVHALYFLKIQVGKKVCALTEPKHFSEAPQKPVIFSFCTLSSVLFSL